MEDQWIWCRKMGNQEPCLKGVQMSQTKDKKMEGNNGGERMHENGKMIRGLEEKACALPKHV